MGDFFIFLLISLCEGDVNENTQKTIPESNYHNGVAFYKYF